ncbi:MAG: thioredoxin-disulfide reductase [Deltaproteobacteria bacterium]|nr:thioredoxin-disulfide reductase [Deltaproteobacteria bacterium]
MPSVENVVIFGSGPAGYTAALYTARASLRPLLFEGYQPGGQLTITTDVENYPGFPEAITGPELMERLRNQAERFGTRIRPERVEATFLDESPLRYRLEGGEEGACRAMIIATGATARYLGLPNEQRLQGRGVSACATCDGFFFRNQHVVVVGGGDTAMEEATYLTHFAQKVTVVHRRAELRASRFMEERARRNEKIAWCLEHNVVDVRGEDSVTGVVVQHVRTGVRQVIDATGLFLAIGHDPNSKPFRPWVRTDPAGYVLTEPGRADTGIPGVFAAGDVRDSVYRQAITAAGSGCAAAIEAERWLAAQD